MLRADVKRYLLDAGDDSRFTSARYNPQHVFCTNFSHHPNRPPIIFVPVASPFLLYPQSSCAKTFCTVCYRKIYINLRTCVIHITEIVVHIVCLYCRLCVCNSHLLKNLTATTTTTTTKIRFRALAFAVWARFTMWDFLFVFCDDLSIYVQPLSSYEPLKSPETQSLRKKNNINSNKRKNSTNYS